MIKKIGILVAALLLLLLALEVGARFYLNRLAGPAALRRYASHAQLEAAGQSAERGGMYTHHRYLGYYPTPNHDDGENRHNALGYRGEEIPQPKPAGEFRIACLGGSTTYTSAIRDHRLAYPHLLGQQLQQQGYANVRVINAGSAGWSSYESLINLELRVLDLDPDLIVVYHALNDIDARLVWPHAAYRGDNSGRRMPNVAPFRAGSFLEESTLLRYVLIRAGWAEPHSAFQRTVDAPPETYVGDDFLKQKQDGSYPSGVFREVSAAEILRANPPVYFRRNLESIVAIARARGARVVLATFAFSPRFPHEPRSSSPEYIDALNEMNRVVADVARATGAGLIDLASSMLSSERFYVDGIHVNHDGARLKAQLVARGLIEGGWLEPGAARAWLPGGSTEQPPIR